MSVAPELLAVVARRYDQLAERATTMARRLQANESTAWDDVADYTVELAASSLSSCLKRGEALAKKAPTEPAPSRRDRIRIAAAAQKPDGKPAIVGVYQAITANTPAKIIMQAYDLSQADYDRIHGQWMRDHQ